MPELRVRISLAVVALAAIASAPAREVQGGSARVRLDFHGGRATNPELSDHLTVDPAGESLEWTRIERDE
ncbi:MAG: hypothetical protein IPN34_15220 [Planctomycetes bacterium]|nr:hypothetical protein [Planctomycetota bacterium]